MAGLIRHVVHYLMVVVGVFLLHPTPGHTATRQGQCVNTCAGRNDGDYPSCQGCDVFVMCIDGNFFDGLSCPPGLKFDSFKKRCAKRSRTCREFTDNVNVPRNSNDGGRSSAGTDISSDDTVDATPAGSPGDACVRECHGRLDGNYQSCKGCNMYASCRQGSIIDGRLCSAGTSWDDALKKCVSISTTCPITTKNGPRTVPVGACVLECKGLVDGLYQSCRGCEYFVSCWDGEMPEERLCHHLGTDLLWDDNAKLCLPSSSTCAPGTSVPKVTTAHTPYHVVTAGVCVMSCDNVADGNYQSCHGCHVFVTCKNGAIFDNRACSETQVWDDVIKECSQKSSTCGASKSSCVTSCSGITTGRYQSCLGCHLYVTCDTAGNLRTSTCADNLVWDDDIKVCVRTSSTCNYGERKRKPPDGTGVVPVPGGEVITTEGDVTTTTSPPTPDTGTGLDVRVLTTETSVTEVDVKNMTLVVPPRTSCISSCENMPDGEYQSCFGCHISALCSAETLRPRSCPADLSWDDAIKRCVSNSSTCGPGFGGCVRECGPLQGTPYCDRREDVCPEGRTAGPSRGTDVFTSVTDGDYQSCIGCNIHVTCSNGATHDGRACPAGLVWDDLIKWCVKTSTTCRQPTTTAASSACVTSCDGMPDGDYQSCRGCTVHVRCLNGKLLDGRSCPKGLKFDSGVGRCVERSVTCGPGRGECVMSCEQLPDGNYRSCSNCSVYATCSSGALNDNQPCPNSLSWDDVIKRCVHTSMTCSDGGDVAQVMSPEEELAVVNATSGGEQWNFTHEGHVGDGVCISSCKGKLNGDYQSCLGCDIFAACLNGVFYDRRPCPDGLVWEDTIKHCMTNSSTCSPGRGGCVSSCSLLPDGQYQSCHGCHVYASCQRGVLEDDRPCPHHEVWDDQRKRCEQTSVTCPKADGRAVPPGMCVHSCEGRPDGDYQSCLGCTGYVTCTTGVIHDNRPCPTGLVWDDTKRRCRYTSPTCRPGRGMCTRTCDGLSDGDYQSCTGCHVYATCLQGELHDSRPCPGGLVWDDSLKRCMRDSHSCRAAHGHTHGSMDLLMALGRRHGSRVQAVTSRGCVESCEGMLDGDYQSCHDCRVYVTCYDGVTNDDRPCPGRATWDDEHKRCLPTSGTCTSFIVVGAGSEAPSRHLGAGRALQNAPERYHDARRTVGPRAENCIRSCEGRENGDYQSCLDCRVYATCLFGTLHDNRACPRHSVWDDRSKRCMYDSSTCHLPGHRPTNRRPGHRRAPPSPPRAASTGSRRRTGSGGALTALPRPLSCTSSCDGLSDGEYQSCHDCRLYASCRDGVLNDFRPCPADTYWDDRHKRCLRSSSTCTGYKPETTDRSLTPRGDRQVAPRSGGCVTSCHGVPDGDYQSCDGCTQYVSCIRGNFFGGRSCPRGLLWDDDRKRCDFTSGSCGSAAASRRVEERRCVSSCGGLEDGNYQSCQGCGVYVTCSGGTLEDGKPCPGRTAWDDNIKRCLWMSITCRQ